MRTTTRGLYALKAMLALASDSSADNPLPLRKIAEREAISAEFLQQIFFRLRKAGLISANRGPGGGFYLAKGEHEITVLEILEASGEALALSPCTRPGAERHAACVDFANCKAGKFWSSLEKELKESIRSRTLADISAL